MNLLLGPALCLILSPAYLRTLDITVLDQRCPTHGHCLVKGNLLVFNKTILPEVFLTFLLLLRHVVCDIGGVAPLVVGVVALHNIIVLRLLHHLHLVNTLLPSSSYSSKAGICISLTLITGSERLCGSFLIMISMFFMVSMVMIMII